MARRAPAALERDDRVAHAGLLVSPDGRELIAHEFGTAGRIAQEELTARLPLEALRGSAGHVHPRAVP
ncbi:hypothetical protein AB0E75_04470 [Streptomyces griseoviridis]|jgi:hypothetical protein|uniref:Uncharacterized protein n=1 Tax=Streptomyces griseoviridis TaxID=45398 RepID=A0A918GLZ6_STRGD|nr:hypothetical protein [Streptomyces niveoruber]GGS46364.1 hypothetical protein GCM10010238_40160 [Streptomyces niveoruber]